MGLESAIFGDQGAQFCDKFLRSRLTSFLGRILHCSSFFCGYQWRVRLEASAQLMPFLLILLVLPLNLSRNELLVFLFDQSIQYIYCFQLFRGEPLWTIITITLLDTYCCIIKIRCLQRKSNKKTIIREFVASTYRTFATVRRPSLGQCHKVPVGDSTYWLTAVRVSKCETVGMVICFQFLREKCASPFMAGMFYEWRMMREGAGREAIYWCDWPFQTVINSLTTYKYKLRKSDPQMFYFVFPTGLPLASLPWMLPCAQLQKKWSVSEKLQYSSECKTSVVENIILSPMPSEGHCSTDSDSRGPNFKNCLPFKEIEDDEYRPLAASPKKSKKSKQMENRNVVPNIVRLILSYIQKKEKSQRVVDLLLKRYNAAGASSIGPKRYYLFQKLVRGKMNNYVNEDTLRELYRMRPEDYEVYPEHEQRVYNRVTRTVIAEFLREEALSCILTSKRMESAKKRNHLQALRTIKSKIRALFQC